MNDIDVDALYDTAMGENVSNEIPMSAPAPAVETKPEVTPAPVVAPEIEFNWNGKQIKTKWDDPRVKQWAAQGYDYSQKISDFNKQKTEFETNQKQFEPYLQIDKWAKENPDKWQSLFNTWKENQAQTGQTPTVAQLPPEVLQKLEEQDQFLKELKQERIEQRIQREDSALESEIKSIREKYPNIDFTAPGQDGKSLEFKVLEHADKNGIKSFKTAFNDFYHDNLLKLAEEKGKTTVSNDIQKKTKLGLLKSSTPTQKPSQFKDVTKMSYEDIFNDIKQEYNIG